MPKKMLNVPVDVFVFYIEPKTQKVVVSFGRMGKVFTSLTENRLNDTILQYKLKL
jgi:hypothetical protein